MKKFKSKKNITELEFLIIEKVKETRIRKGMSKMELSEAIGVSKSFIGKVESHAHHDKYNFKHLYRIAIVLGIKSLKDLMPKEIPQHEDIEIIYEMVPKINKDGSESKQFESNVLEVTPVER